MAHSLLYAPDNKIEVRRIYAMQPVLKGINGQYIVIAHLLEREIGRLMSSYTLVEV